MNHLILLVLLVSLIVFMSNACEFGSDTIQTGYDRFELFRKTKAVDPADAEIPLEQYHYYINNGVKRLVVKFNGTYMVEYYESDGDNEIQTKNGQYSVKDGVILNYKRDENGEFSFDDWSNNKKFTSSLRSIDAKLPNDFEKNYRQVLIDLNAMRKKMFDYQNSLSKEDIERVQLFELTPFSNGDGFNAQYIENGGVSLTVYKRSGSNEISGRLSCVYKYQKYHIVDGKVVVDGEPSFSDYD